MKKQSLLAMLGLICFLSAFGVTRLLLADNPVPPGANYEEFNQDLVWELPTNNEGEVIPGKVCKAKTAGCLTYDACYTPYYATFNGNEYQSMKPKKFFVANYGKCSEPQGSGGGTNPCTQKAVLCQRVELFSDVNCPKFDPNKIERDAYDTKACAFGS